MEKKSELLFTVILSVLAVFAISFFWQVEYILLFALFVLSLLLLFIKQSKVELELFIVCGVCGAFTESIAISFGAWQYMGQLFINFPVWLVFFWGIVSVLIGRVYMYVKH